MSVPDGFSENYKHDINTVTSCDGKRTKRPY